MRLPGGGEHGRRLVAARDRLEGFADLQHMPQFGLGAGPADAGQPGTGPGWVREVVRWHPVDDGVLLRTASKNASSATGSAILTPNHHCSLDKLHRSAHTLLASLPHTHDHVFYSQATSPELRRSQASAGRLSNDKLTALEPPPDGEVLICCTRPGTDIVLDM